MVATTPKAGGDVLAATDEATITPDAEVTTEPTTPDEPYPKKPRKLKVKANTPPKKLSMTTSALQVLQARKVAMTCPELIDVMVTEELWGSPSGNTPANTLFAAISRDIKVNGTASSFRKAERGKFEVS